MRSFFICKRWEVFGDSDVSLVSAAVCCSGWNLMSITDWDTLQMTWTYGPTLELPSLTSPIDSREILRNTWLQRKHCIFGIHIQRTNILGGLFGDDLWTWFTIYCWLQPRCWTLIGCGVICSFGKRATSVPSSQNLHICPLHSKSPSHMRVRSLQKKRDLEENCGKTGESDLL